MVNINEKYIKSKISDLVFMQGNKRYILKSELEKLDSLEKELACIYLSKNNFWLLA